MMNRLLPGRVNFVSVSIVLLLLSWHCLANVDLQLWLDDFYLTLPEPQEVVQEKLVAIGKPAIATPLPPRPLLLLRPSLDYWGLAWWSWAGASTIVCLGLAAVLAKMLAKRRLLTDSAYRQKQRRARREIKTLLTNGTDLEQALPWLAMWHDLPDNCNGTEIADALQDKDPIMAAAVAQWEQVRFSSTEEDPEKMRAAISQWQESLWRWLRYSKCQNAQTMQNLTVLAMGAGIQMQSPAEQALIWNRLVRLPKTVAASIAQFWPSWFSAEIALLIFAAALVGGLLAWLYLGKGALRRWLTILAVLLVLPASARLLITHRQQQRQLSAAAIVQRQDFLRAAPESNLAFGNTVSTGDLVFIKAVQGDWLQVQSRQNLGWLQKTAVTQQCPWKQD